MNYIGKMLPLVRRMNTHNQLLWFARFFAGLTPKIAKKQHLTAPFSGIKTETFCLLVISRF